MDLKYAVTNLVTEWHGDKVVLAADEPWHASDPFVKAHPDLFVDTPRVVRGYAERPAARRGQADAEAATAVPGEKRTTRRAK
jgi:hypothetical protein